MGRSALKPARTAVFFDRDGVLNKAVVRDGRPHPPSASELVLEDDVQSAFAKLVTVVPLTFVITNQPDVARGTRRHSDIEAANEVVAGALPLTAFYTCYHDDADECDCRKPRAGLLLQAAADYDLDLRSSYLVGDRWRDIDAGATAGATTIFIEHHYAERRPSFEPDLTVTTTAAAIDAIVEFENGRLRCARIEKLMTSLGDLKVKIFADGADKAGMLEMYAKPYIKGFTTNPTLMRKAGITDFEKFGRDILASIPDRPISIEVFADEADEIERQACEIATWGRNVYVKIPVTNTRGVTNASLIRSLAARKVKQNITALMTIEQVAEVSEALGEDAPSCVSVFAGRVADTGCDPVPLMTEAVRILARHPTQELIWASPRELLNIFHANDVGCHIITVTNDILGKLPNIGKSLEEYSLDTVRMFYDDAKRAGFTISVPTGVPA